MNVLKIMVVDDEPDLQMLILQRFRKQIQSGTYEFVFAANGEEALGQLQDGHEIMLVLSDINMPRMDGLTFLQRLQENNESGVKTIMVSAYGDLENIRVAMNRGAFDFVTKPIDFNDLHLTIEKGWREIIAVRAAHEDRRNLVAVQQDLSAASRIQQTILPQTFPPFPHRPEFSLYAEMHPARDIGGDFYDFFFIDESHLAFVIGDVSGKGIPAAIYMAVARTMIKGIASQVLDPAECLTKVNAVLIPESEASMFVTVFYGVLDTHTGIVRYCNGGHNLPFVVRHASTVDQIENAPGILLGQFDHVKFEARQIQLGPGDRIVLYTDGVTEAMNAAQDMYAETRLQQLLESDKPDSVMSLVRGVMADVMKFVGKAEQSDDITVFSLEYRGPGQGAVG